MPNYGNGGCSKRGGGGGGRGSCERGGRSRGRGESNRGRGESSRGRGESSRGRGGSSRGLGREQATPDFAVAGPSTRTVEEEYALIKKNFQHTKKVVKSLAPSIRKELISRKRVKELTRSLLPDAPPRKRARKDSPERKDCRLIPGTPETPPAPKLQPWQISDDASLKTEDPEAKNTKTETQKQIRIIDYDRNCLSPLSTTSAISSEVPELLVDWTTGELKNQSASVVPSHSSNVRVLNNSIKNAGDFNIEAMLDEMGDSDDDELDVDDNYQVNDQTHGHLTSANVTDDLTENLRTWLETDDTKSDELLRRLLPADQYIFDWNCDHDTFKGQRETFRGTHGPTFPVTDDTKPLDIFLKIFDDDFFHLLVSQTNRYASRNIDSRNTPHSRLNSFTNVDKNEMAIFLAILILQSLVPLPVETHYWSENGYLTLKYFKDLMMYNRYALLKRLLHFTDIDTTRLNLTKDEKRLRKIQPVLDIFNKKFSSLYFPGQNICIDESLLKWKGRLSFAQKISTKAAKNGIKSYELCESATGYLWNFFVYAGKTDEQTDRQSDEPTDRQPNEPTDGQTDRQSNEPTDGQTDRQSDQLSLPSGATSRIVNDLAGPLFDRGHTLVMDNFYNSPLLARYLKSKGTDCYGTLRVNREFVPEALKSVQKSELRQGELVQSFTPDLSVMLWRDTNMVAMISTFHTGVVGGKEKYGRFKYKPEVVLDYNLAMGGVDKKDQLLSSFPMERVRNQVWYKKVFRRLLNCAVMNSYIIYKSHTPHATHRCFRNQLAEDLIKTFKPPQLQRPIKLVPEMHMSTNTNKLRPILSGNHFIGTGTSKYSICVCCRKCRTKYICKQCGVSLCLQICFENYHTVPEPRST